MAARIRYKLDLVEYSTGTADTPDRCDHALQLHIPSHYHDATARTASAATGGVDTS